MALVIWGFPNDALTFTDTTDGGRIPETGDAEVGKPSDMLGKAGLSNARVIDAICGTDPEAGREVLPVLVELAPSDEEESPLPREVADDVSLSVEVDVLSP